MNRLISTIKSLKSSRIITFTDYSEIERSIPNSMILSLNMRMPLLRLRTSKIPSLS
jgi:hypothetical protein